MTISPINAAAYSAAVAVFISLVTKGASSVGALDIPACDDLGDVLNGCDSTRSRILTLAVLGTVPGAAPEFNVVMAFIGLTCRGIVIWSLLRLGRGGG